VAFYFIISWWDFRTSPNQRFKYRKRACTQSGPFPTLRAELGCFHFLEIVTGWMVPSHWSVRRSQYSLAGTFHRGKSRLLKTGFFRQVKGAENTKEKSRQCFMLNMRINGV
jgi:hypothetical protein